MSHMSQATRGGAALNLVDPIENTEKVLGVIGPDDTEACIGTGEGAKFRLNDLRCSGIHALIERSEDGGYRLVDLGSHFGTYVKGRRISEIEISPGEEFKIGQQTLKLVPLPEQDSTPEEADSREQARDPQYAAESKQPLLTDLKLLQISLYWGEKLLDLRTFKSGSEITLGSSRDATFEVVLPEMEIGSGLFRIAKYEKGMVTLHIPPSATGLLWIGDETHALDTLRHRKADSHGFDGFLDITLRLGDRASIEIGELTLVINFATPAPRIPRFLKPVLDKTLLRILGGLAGVYLILFLFLSFGSIEEKEKTLEDVPKHLKKVLYNAGIEQARKIQEAAIGQIAQNLEGGRARLEEGKASSSKVAEQKKKSTKPEKTKSPPQKVAQEKTSAPKVAEKATPPKPVTVDLNSAFATATTQSNIVSAAKNAESSSAQAKSGNTAAALMSGGFARGRTGLGAGGGGKGVGIGQLTGNSTGGGMGAGDYGLEPSKGREIQIAEEEEVIILGGLDPDVIAAIIKRYLSQIRNCYEQQLVTHPNLKGKVAVSFVIGGDGTVRKADIAETTLNNAATESCILSKIRTWKFPKPLGGGSVGVKYPFLLMSNSGD